MAAIAGAAVASGVALALASRPRRRRQPLRAAELGAGADQSPLIPRAPDSPKTRRKSACSPTRGKYWVSMCMDMPAGPGPTIRHADDACAVLRRETHLEQADRESFYAVLLDVRSQVMGIDEVAKGTMTGVEVHPREAFRSAIMAGASAVVFAHNHPSGDATPSNDDIELTRRMAKVGHMVGVPVVDHVVVGKVWPGRPKNPSCASIAELRPNLFRVED